MNRSMCQPSRAARRRKGLDAGHRIAAQQDRGEADAAKSESVEPAQLLVADIGLDHRHRPRPVPEPRQPIGGRRQVGGVAARLDDHRALDPQRLLQGGIGLQRRLGCGVEPAVVEREPVIRPDDVGMGVASPRRCPGNRRARRQGSRARSGHRGPTVVPRLRSGRLADRRSIVAPPRVRRNRSPCAAIPARPDICAERLLRSLRSVEMTVAGGPHRARLRSIRPAVTGGGATAGTVPSGPDTF